MQHEIRAARDHADRVDLQQPHLFDGRDDIGSAGASPLRLKQALRVQMQQPRLGRGNDVSTPACGFQRHGSFTDSRTR